MGEMAIDTDMLTAWLQPDGVFLSVWSHPVAIFLFAVITSVYGAQKLLRTLGDFLRYRSFRWAKVKNLSHTYWLALNNALFLLVVLLALQGVIGLDRLVGDEVERLRYYAEAYRPLAIAAAILIMAQITWVYIGVFRRVGSQDNNGSLRYLHEELRKRGFRRFEIFGVPPLAIMFELGPALMRWVV